MTNNRCELSAIILENFEITCLKWLKNHTCAPVKPSVTNENSFFFSSFIFVFVNLALKSKEVKCDQIWLKNGVKSEFYCPFLTSILMINLFTYALHS